MNDLITVYYLPTGVGLGVPGVSPRTGETRNEIQNMPFGHFFISPTASVGVGVLVICSMNEQIKKGVRYCHYFLQKQKAL